MIAVCLGQAPAAQPPRMAVTRGAPQCRALLHCAGPKPAGSAKRAWSPQYGGATCDVLEDATCKHHSLDFVARAPHHTKLARANEARYPRNSTYAPIDSQSSKSTAVSFFPNPITTTTARSLQHEPGYPQELPKVTGLVRNKMKQNIYIQISPQKRDLRCRLRA